MRTLIFALVDMRKICWQCYNWIAKTLFNLRKESIGCNNMHISSSIRYTVYTFAVETHCNHSLILLLKMVCCYFSGKIEGIAIWFYTTTTTMQFFQQLFSDTVRVLLFCPVLREPSWYLGSVVKLLFLSTIGRLERRGWVHCHTETLM